MPIYEFYCPHCHRVFNFLSRRIDTRKIPACPDCEQKGLTRRASAFAISKGRTEPPKPGSAEPEVDEARLERAMQALAGEMASLDENDPRQGAHLMRKLFDATGLPVAGGMEEALRRMEAGEDPEKIEEDMGEVLEGDPFGGLLGGDEAKDPDAGEKKRRGRLRRILPPTVDPELHEM